VEHPSDDLLTSYVLDPQLVGDRTALEAHLETCAECRARLAEARSFESLLHDDASWPDEEVEVDLRASAAARAQEDADAAVLLERVLDGPPASFVFANLQEKPKYYTAGVVRHLIAATAAAWFTEPLHALNLAETAIAITGLLPEGRYKDIELASLRGTAWKMRANALRFLGRYPLASEALDRAERIYARLPRPELDLAAVRYIRATIFYEQESYERAAALAAQTSDEFSHLGQSEMYFSSRMLEASIAFEQRELEMAEGIFRQIYAHGESAGSANWIARASQNLGTCLIEQGQLTEATQRLSTAMLRFRDLRILIEEVRCRWSLARIAQKSGQYHLAVQRLRAVRDEFTQMGATTDAALVTLDLMETYLSLRKPVEARRAAGNIVALFTDVGMLTGAVVAANWLKQTAAAKRVTPSILDAIRRYLRRVDLQPDSAFVPPAL
jgi:tetratricopeptide (TPR) repeat protein